VARLGTHHRQRSPGALPPMPTGGASLARLLPPANKRLCAYHVGRGCPRFGRVARRFPHFPPALWRTPRRASRLPERLTLWRFLPAQRARYRRRYAAAHWRICITLLRIRVPTELSSCSTSCRSVSSHVAGGVRDGMTSVARRQRSLSPLVFASAALLRLPTRMGAPAHSGFLSISIGFYGCTRRMTRTACTGMLKRRRGA